MWQTICCYVKMNIQICTFIHMCKCPYTEFLFVAPWWLYLLMSATQFIVWKGSAMKTVHTNWNYVFFWQGIKSRQRLFARINFAFFFPGETDFDRWQETAAWHWVCQTANWNSVDSVSVQSSASQWQQNPKIYLDKLSLLFSVWWSSTLLN